MCWSSYTWNCWKILFTHNSKLLLFQFHYILFLRNCTRYKKQWVTETHTDKKWIKNKIYIVGVRFSSKCTFVKLVLKHSFLLLLVFQDFVPKFLESLTDDELKKEAKNEVKNDALSSIIKVKRFWFYCNIIITFYPLFLGWLSYNVVISSVMPCVILLLRMISLNPRGIKRSRIF